jgi:peptide/nickel transport system substrate-binding protein
VSWETTSAFATMIFEKKFGDAHKGTMGRPGVGIMGTGPWVLQSFDPTRGVEFSANPRYWGGKVAIQRVSVKTISDTTAQALAYRTGQIDFVPSVIDVRGFESAAAAKTVSVASCGQSNISLNTGVAPWNDVHVRRAVAYAMNRADIIKASGAPGSPLEMVIPPTLLRTLGTKAQVDALVKSLPLHPYNLAKAKQEMAQSKYPNGFTATLSAYAYGGSLQEMQVLAAQLEKVGIKLDLDNIGLSGALAKWFGPREKLGLEYVAGWGCNPDVAFLPNLLLPSKDARAGALNLANYKNATVDSLLQQGKQVSNPAKRLAIYGKLLRQLAIDVPYLAVYSPTQNFALTSKFGWKDATGFWFGTSGWLLGVKPK